MNPVERYIVITIYENRLWMQQLMQNMVLCKDASGVVEYSIEQADCEYLKRPNIFMTIVKSVYFYRISL
jgi:hypothetical protein